jgi:hypothetical protein
VKVVCKNRCAKHERSDCEQIPRSGIDYAIFDRDDINKQQRSIAVIATIFIGSWSDESICSTSALFNPAARDFASRVLFFQRAGSEDINTAVEEVPAVMVGDALLAITAKSGRVSAYNGPSSTLT